MYLLEPKPFCECEGRCRLYFILAHILPYRLLPIPRENPIHAPIRLVIPLRVEPQPAPPWCLRRIRVVLDVEIHKVVQSVLCEFGRADGGKGSLHAAAIGGRHKVSRNHLVELCEGKVNRESVQTDGFKPGHEDGVVERELSAFFLFWLWRDKKFGVGKVKALTDLEFEQFLELFEVILIDIFLPSDLC